VAAVGEAADLETLINIPVSLRIPRLNPVSLPPALVDLLDLLKDEKTMRCLLDHAVALLEDGTTTDVGMKVR